VTGLHVGCGGHVAAVTGEGQKLRLAWPNILPDVIRFGNSRPVGDS
jgi:hypothetical protein